MVRDKKKIHNHSGKHYQSHIPRIFEWRKWRIYAESHTRTNTVLEKLEVVIKQFLGFDSTDPNFMKIYLFFKLKKTGNLDLLNRNPKIA